jgi:ubiquinone/menaquinone biosynthesis C-methylase UbiE
MPDELTTFQTKGPSWSDRADAGELAAVLSPTGTEKRNRFLHGIQMVGAKKVANLIDSHPQAIVDFGCGTGRFIRFFSEYGHSVAGTEITAEMISEAEKFGVPEQTQLFLTDGIHIPVPDRSVDIIWCCGVLRFSLLIPDPVYPEIVREMGRVLKEGGKVFNIEMYVDNPANVFTKDFEENGFITKDVRVLHRYNGILERGVQKLSPSSKISELAGSFCASYRYQFDSAMKDSSGLRDYLFTWEKSGSI